MQKFKIRAAQIEDAGLILAFIKGIADFEKMSDEVEATEASIVKYLFSEQAFVHCLLAYENQTPVGFALYFYNYSSFVSKPGLYLEDLYIMPAFRHQGYGKELMRQLIQIASENGCGRMEWNVLKWNQKAIDWYEKLGAKAMSEWTTYRLNQATIEQLNEAINQSNSI
jgi:GNAT superfamily N-acetyltransferase